MKKYWWRDKKWIAKSKQIIKIKNMSNKHIGNCINYLKDKGFISKQTLNIYLNTSMSLEGMTQLSFEQKFLETIESPVNPWIDIFELELEYRKKNKIIIYDGGKFKLRCERGIKTWIGRILIRNID